MWALRGACWDPAGNTLKCQPSGTRATLAETTLGVVIWELGTATWRHQQEHGQRLLYWEQIQKV